jgi:hypothetical protein
VDWADASVIAPAAVPATSADIKRRASGPARRRPEDGNPFAVFWTIRIGGYMAQDAIWGKRADRWSNIRLENHPNRIEFPLVPGDRQIGHT